MLVTINGVERDRGVAARIRVTGHPTRWAARVPGETAMRLPLDAESRIRLQEKLMRKAEDEIRALRLNVEKLMPEEIDERVNAIESFLNAEDFPAQRRIEYLDKTKALRREGYQRTVISLLDRAVVAAREDDRRRKNDLLAQGRRYFAIAMRLGSDDDFKQGVQRRLDAVITSSPRSVPPEPVKRDALENKRASVDNAPGGIERRRCVRYYAPTLMITIGGNHYKTVDWSIRGLAIAAYDGPLEVGQKTRLDIWLEGVPTIGRTSATVVRREGNLITCLEFPGIDISVLEILKAMKDRGIPPLSKR